MMTTSSTLMSFPPVWWWAAVCRMERVELSIGAPFRKMTWNNRYRIATANGPLLLSVPIAGGRSQRIPFHEVRIDNKTDWQQQHWRSLFSGYGRAPFFEHYAPALEGMMHRRYDRLADFCLEALYWVAAELRLTTVLEPVPQDRYYPAGPAGTAIPYPQVFEDRHGFIPDLSIIDLLMNEGPAAIRLLER